MAGTPVPTLVDGDDFTDDFTLGVKAAMDELQRCFVTTSITPASGITLSCRLIRTPTLVGPDLVTMTVCTMTNGTGSTLTNGQTLLTVPTGYRPSVTRRLMGFNASTGLNNMSANLNNTGVLAIHVAGGWVAPTNGQAFGFYSAAWETTEATP